MCTSKFGCAIQPSVITEYFNSPYQKHILAVTSKREDLPFRERIHIFQFGNNHPLSEDKKFKLLLCMSLVVGASRNISLSDKIFGNFSLNVLKIYCQVFFLILKICYWLLSSAYGRNFSSCSGNFIQTFTARWTIIMVLLFYMKQILILVRIIFVELIYLSNDFKTINFFF